MAWAALCFIAGASSAVLDKTWIAVCSAIFLTVLWMICLPKRLCGRHHIVILIFIYLGFSITCRNLRPTELSSLLKEHNGEVGASVEGTVTKIRTDGASRQIIISRCTLRDHEGCTAKNILIYADCGKGECHEGDVIVAEGRLSEFQKPMNTGEFDSAGYYASMNVSARITAEEVRVIKENKNRIIAAVFRIKDGMKKSFMNTASQKDAGVIMSIVLGDKTELDSDISGLYQRNGIAHILAISGLHISLIGMTLYRLLRRAGLIFWQSAAVSVAVIICYGIMTGSAVSAIRAIVMFTVSAGARVLGRKYDMLSAASLAAILILADMPMMLTNSGFLLSFGAVMGIVKVYPVFENILPKRDKSFKKNILKSLCPPLAISASVSLATLPVVLSSFYEFSFLSVLLNLIVIPLTGLLMAAGLAGGLIGMIWRYGGRFVMGTVHYILELFGFICSMSEKLPFGRIITGIPDTKRIILYYFIMAIFVIMPYIVKDKKRLAPILVLTSAVMMSVLFFAPAGELEINMLYVGQGDGIYVKLPGGTSMLFDGGSSDKKELGRYTLAPCLKADGISELEYIFISHTDEDHYSGVLYLIENQKASGIRVKNLVMPDISERDEAYERLVRAAVDNGTDTAIFGKGAKITAADGEFMLECLAPKRDAVFSGKNASSAVYRMTYKDFSMIFTGDIEKDGEKMLLESGVLSQCDVLKVAHHGSDNSTPKEFLDKTSPSAALISCGINNRYKHPGNKLLGRLEDSGAANYITAECGQIKIKSNGRDYKIMIK